MIETATSGTYSTYAATEADAGTYTLTVSNLAGTVTSTETVVAVRPVQPPVIYGLPGSLVLNYGQSLQLSPSTMGTQPMAFVWRRNGVVLTSRSSANFEKSSVTAADAGSYTLTATNPAGTVTSVAVEVTVLAPVAPAIYGLPSTVVRDHGTTLSISPSVIGSTPMTFQWMKDGVDLVDSTSSSLWKSQATVADSGAYTLRATNLVGSAISTVVTVIVQEPAAPAIYGLPESLLLDYGAYLSVSPTVTGTSPITCRWRKDGVLLPSDLSAYFSRSYVTEADSGDYTLTVSNQSGTFTSAPMRVTVKAALPPTITYQPRSLVCFPGHTANFRAAATGTNPFSYQWYRNGVAIPGATGAALQVPDVNAALTGRYQLVISNPAGAAYTTEARLEIDPGLAVTAVAASAGGSAWIRSDRSLWTAGYNYYGQLGDGSRTDRTNSLQVADDVVAVALGSDHLLFVKRDGTLWAAGNNTSGQLGTGSHAAEPAPVQVASGAVAVAAGYYTSFFIKDDHTLWAMGLNDDGRLGDGTAESRATPPQIATDVRKVAAGVGHCLFVKGDGTLWAFGINYSGQVGNGSYSSQSRPVQIDTEVSEVAAAGDHSAYIKADGTLWSMGSNGAGQLGDGSTTSRNSPVQVASGIRSVTLGSDVMLYIDATGQLWGVGNNSNRQLGGTSTGNLASAIPIIDNATAAAAGAMYTLILRGDGTLWGLGTPSNGQFGDGLGYGTVTLPRQLTWHTATAPVITDQPDSQAVAIGANVTFAIGVSSDLPYTIQWRRDGTPLPGAGAESLTIAGVGPGHVGSYDAIVTSAEGSTVSASAALTLLAQYAAWAETVFTAGEWAVPTISGSLADPDGDGYRNLVEYALGLDPMGDAPSAGPEVSADATHWLFTFTRPKDRPDLTYTVEYSTDLGTWTEIAAGDIAEIASTATTVTIQARQPLTTANVFFRLKVSCE